MSEKLEEVFNALKELLEYVEEEGTGIQEHDFFTDHDNDQCVLCKAREVVNKYEEKQERHEALTKELIDVLNGRF
jgi:hypothetical protein